MPDVKAGDFLAKVNGQPVTAAGTAAAGKTVVLKAGAAPPGGGGGAEKSKDVPKDCVVAYDKNHKVTKISPKPESFPELTVGSTLTKVEGTGPGATALKPNTDGEVKGDPAKGVKITWTPKP